jgi:hypothetical protein
VYNFGLLVVMILVMAVIILLGAAVLGVIYEILNLTKNRIIHLGIPVLVMVLGFYLFMKADAPTLVVITIFFVVPMAALLPAFLIPGLVEPKTGLKRIVLCYLLVSVFAVLFSFYVAVSHIWMIPEIYWTIPLSNAIIYACLVALELGLAFVVYRVMKERNIPSIKEDA